MDKRAALSFLDKLIQDEGIDGIKRFAAAAGFKWETAYAWYRRVNVPEWRLEAFARGVKAMNSRKKAA